MTTRDTDRPDTEEVREPDEVLLADAKEQGDEHCQSISALTAKMQRLAKRAVERQKKQQPIEPKKAVDNVVRLPVWGETARGMPNGFLRSALFGAIAKGRRRFFNREQIASIDGVEIFYTGERLDQGDLDVYESVLHLLREYDMGRECRVTSYELLKLMGQTDCGKNRITLQIRMERLRANAVRMKQGDRTFIGGLIDSAYKDKRNNQEWVIILNPMLRELYEDNQFTKVDWEVRHALKRSQLAQWLHGFYATHAHPYAIKVETFYRLCGSENKRISNFKIELKNSLDTLAKAYESQGQLFRYKIENGLVHVEKEVSESQKQHLERKAKK